MCRPTTQGDVRSLTPDLDSLSYGTNLKPADPDEVQVFIDANIPKSPDAPILVSWEVGLLKAVGATPGPVVAAAGLAVGSLTAALLTESSAGLIGSAGTPSMTLSTVGWMTAVAVGVAVVATIVPAVRAARSSRLGGRRPVTETLQAELA